MESYLDVLDKISYNITNKINNEKDLDDFLASLTPIVSQSSSSESIRTEMGYSEKVCATINKTLETYDFGLQDAGSILTEKRQRVFRGILLLVRNISTVKNKLNDEIIFTSMEKFIDETQVKDEITRRTLVAYKQIWANIINRTNDLHANFGFSILRKEAQQSMLFHDEELEAPNLRILKKLLEVDENIRFLLSETENEVIMHTILQRFNRIDFTASLQTADNSFLEALEMIISNESYGKFLNRQISNENIFQDYMKLNQITLTAKEDWDNYQVVSLLGWLYELFLIFSRTSEEKLVDHSGQEELSFTHGILVIILDCISDLCKFNSTKQFLDSYRVLEPLINLLRIVQENSARGSLKVKAETSNLPKFPHVKSLIIEIIACLTHKSFETQEQIRQLHGLELLLSNCIIDDNEPFIKERSIMCLKFVLEGNKDNQKFVADLEAKETYDETALNEIGYEVDITNGKLSMKRKKD